MLMKIPPRHNIGWQQKYAEANAGNAAGAAASAYIAHQIKQAQKGAWRAAQNAGVSPTNARVIDAEFEVVKPGNSITKE